MIKQLIRSKKSLRLFFTIAHLVVSFINITVLLLGVGLIPKLDNITKSINTNSELVFCLMLITIIFEAVCFVILKCCDNSYLEEIVDTIARERENIKRSISSDIEKTKTTTEEIKEKSERFNKECAEFLSKAKRQNIELDFELKKVNHDIKYLQSRLND